MCVVDAGSDMKKLDNKRNLEMIPEAEALTTTGATTDAAGKPTKKKKKPKVRKEKSVLQTKLTKLAIQIGYAGT